MVRLGRCNLNPNHWYSLHVPECPWCRILREQGKDHFPVRQSFPPQLPVNAGTSPVFPAESPPLPAPAPQTSTGLTNSKLFAVLIIGLVVIGIIVLVPLMQGKQPATSPVRQPTQMATIAKPQYSPTVVPTRLGQSAEVVLPYHETLALNYNDYTRSFNSVKAPVSVQLTTRPLMINDKKIVFSGVSDNSGTEYDITRPDENAYSEIVVRDLTTGAVVAQEGYGKLYSSESPKKITLLKEGHYEVAISGAKTTIDLAVTA
jgi:hypothetical protein